MKKQNWILNLITILLICSFATSGCKFFYSTKLRAPSLTVNESDMTLMWDTNYNASAYEIQMNESVIDTVENDGQRTQYTYSYADAVGSFGEFRFRVKCIGSGKYADSDLSVTVTVKVGTAGDYLNKNVSDVEYVYDENYAVTNITIADNRLSWNAINTPNLTGYLVAIYTNTLGVKHYETTNTYLVLNSLLTSGHDILAIKICSVVDGVNYETEDVYYYNPIDEDKYGVYTDTIYVFDGEVYDYYIENWTELQNLYYYAFIYRIESLEFLVSDVFYHEYEDTYFDTTFGRADNYILGTGNTAYFETAGFDMSPTLTRKIYTTKEFKLKCRFSDFDTTKPGVNPEPYVEGTPYYTQDIMYTPYYETVNYDKRPETYDNFVSDNWYLSTEVNTSEELFWAVSTHVTPIFSSTTSRAYLIYEEAKNVLRQIISDDMTDYEKVVSIFDYIMLNTTYDYNTFRGNTSENPMKYMCYYLEGVFLSGNRLSVCDGYSKAFTLLCSMEGINSVRITGIANGGGHAWNKVEINGNWYVVDLTWTAISADLDGDYNYTDEVCSHTYFLIGDKDIDTHQEFSNRYVYSLLDSNTSYNYYVNDKVNANNELSTRVISSIDDLKDVLTNSLIDNYKGVEVILEYNFIMAHGMDITEIIKSAKEYSFIAILRTPYVSVYGQYVKVYYDSEDLNKFGILMMIKPSITITTNTRFNEFVEYVKEINPEKHSQVCLSVNKIHDWIGDDYSSDDEMISLLEDYFNESFGEGISVNIQRIEEDVTENVFTQDEEGNWIETVMTSGSYSFEFEYSL